MPTDDTQDPADQRDKDATPAPKPPEPARPAPSIVFPGFKQVKIVGGERKEEPEVGCDDATQEAPAIDPSLTGREETLLGQAPEQPLSGREATLVGGGDAAPAAPLTGREATMIGAGNGPTPTPLTGREATMIGEAAGALTGREATLLGGGEAAAAGATVLGSDEGTAATIAPGNTLAQTGGDRTPPTYGGRPQTRVGSSAAFDASWHLAGRKGPFTGQTWGDFELGGILGEGGMGAVYRAMQKSLKRRVAIKVLPPNLAQDANLLHRFQLEASTSSKLSSPHIVQVYFIGEEDGNHYFAMEYVDGTDLYDVHKARKDSDNPMSPEEAAEFILQGARGLAEAGRYGIVHRDIKPPNMMVDKTGLLKIADFGIVKVLGDHQLTMTGQAVGTPAYCSPEQGRGDSDIDQRSDLYSLGVVFYELACGKKPFEATTPNALIYKHCFEEPELPKLLNPAISSEIQAVILRLLQKKAENRYQSADELVRDLEALKTGAMLESALANIRGTGASEAKREQMGWLQRHLVPVLVAAGLGVAAVGATGYWFLQQRQAEELQARRATQELRPTIAEALDHARSLPADIAAMLDEYGQLAVDGENDPDLKRWRAKLGRVRALQAALAPLDDGLSEVAVRRQAEKDLALYADEVGADDAAAQRWRTRLQELQGEEDAVRAGMRDLQAGLLDQAARDALVNRSARLAVLAGDQDEQVLAARKRIGDFDQQVAALEGELTVIDEGKAITEAQRGRLLTALGQFSPLVGSGDARVERWRVALDRAAGQVDTLRAQLSAAIGTSSSLPLSTIDAVSGDLELYAELVAGDDRNLASWRKQVEVSQKRVDTLRARLEGLRDQQDEQATLPAPVLPGLAATIEDLKAQAGQGDPQVMTWTAVLRRSESTLSGLRERCLRLDGNNPAPIGLLQQAELSAALDRLEAKDGLEPALVGSYRARLAQEAIRVKDLRGRLRAMDQAVPFTSGLESDLERLTLDLDGQSADSELLRWQAKRDRIVTLREQLAVLDQRRSVPDDLQQRFEALIAEVGRDAVEIRRWAPKVALIAELRADLSTLLEAQPLPEEVDAKLALWAEQVGTEDAIYVRFRAKVERVRTLAASLGALAGLQAFTPEDQERAHSELTELVTLVGVEDRAVRAAARRLSELDGPAIPAWAGSHGRDEFGLWAVLDPDGLDLRLRYCPPGRFVMGEADPQAAGEDDEVPVAVTISSGFWIGDSELTQAQWSALMGENPSYFKGSQRPVERVSVADAQACLAALDRIHGTPGARLPTEAEWEFACRGGHPLPPRSELESQAWYQANSGDSSQGIRGRYANALGLYDMLGNVSEWTADGYGSYPTAASVDPARPGGSRRVVRGGSWGDPADSVRIANRIAVDPDVRSMYLGFRAVVPATWTTPADGKALLDQLAAGQGEQTWSLTLGDARIQVVMPKRRTQKPTATPDHAATQENPQPQAAPSPAETADDVPSDQVHQPETAGTMTEPTDDAHLAPEEPDRTTTANPPADGDSPEEPLP